MSYISFKIIFFLEVYKEFYHSIPTKELTNNKSIMENSYKILRFKQAVNDASNQN